MGLVAWGSTLNAEINLADYPEQIDYGTLTAAEQDIFNDILSAVAEGNAVVQCNETIDHNKILTHLGLYYGSTKGVGKLFVLVNGDIHLNLNAFPEYEQNRQKVNATVEEALSHIREGSDGYKLRQIADYIADHFTYVKDEFVCADYAMLFYKMASRLGIKSYICFGYAGGGLHMWNMVEMNHKRYFYDVTWYDSTNKIRYIGTQLPWCREFAINDAWKIYNINLYYIFSYIGIRYSDTIRIS